MADWRLVGWMAGCLAGWMVCRLVCLGLLVCVFVGGLASKQASGRQASSLWLFVLYFVWFELILCAGVMLMLLLLLLLLAFIVVVVVAVCFVLLVGWFDGSGVAEILFLKIVTRCSSKWIEHLSGWWTLERFEVTNFCFWFCFCIWFSESEISSISKNRTSAEKEEEEEKNKIKWISSCSGKSVNWHHPLLCESVCVHVYGMHVGWLYSYT